MRLSGVLDSYGRRLSDNLSETETSAAAVQLCQNSFSNFLNWGYKKCFYIIIPCRYHLCTLNFFRYRIKVVRLIPVLRATSTSLMPA